MKKIKVIHFLGTLAMGGAEKLVVDYALSLDKSRFNVWIICKDSSSNTINEVILKENNIKIIFLGDIIPKKLNKIKPIKVLFKILLLNKIIKTIKPDIIHSHLSSTQMLIFTNCKKIKMFHTIHSEIKAFFNKNNLYKWSLKYLIKYKNITLITLHQRMAEEAKKLFNTKNCIVLRNGIDLNKFKTDIGIRKSKRQELGITEKDFLVGHIGRFAKPKNHKFLLKVFYELNKIQPHSKLLLIGAGPLENDINSKIQKLGLENYVIQLGNRADIGELLNAMDAFVFPSLYEGFGLVVLEAQAVGVRTIVSDAVPDDAIVSKNVIKLSLEDSPKKWAKYILEAKPTTDCKEKIKKYDMKVIVKELEKIYIKNLKREK
ncbi:MAG: hypothetical protein ATN32_04735 [Candidatus Epulonipiscium fishelsonii]|nr:MAG: hypothetical protein ATN32_04735 [Epulopiscium sp. AS2M-Bin002]